MRSVAAVLASVFILSCGRSTPPPAPTSPIAPQNPSIYVVSGVVRDDKGVPVADAVVFVGCGACKTGPGFTRTTDASGSYSGSLPAGTFDIFVRKPGYTTLSLYGGIVLSTNTTRDLTLKPGVQIFGRTFEQGVGSLTGVLIEVIGGPSAGQSTTTRPPGVENAYTLALLPGEHRIRASKAGYDPVERTVTATVDVSNVDFTLKWAYGSCLRSVSPVLFDGYRSSGGEETVMVDVSPGRAWSAAPDQPWLEVTAAPRHDSGRLTFRVLPHPAGAATTRTGAIMIRCSASESTICISSSPRIERARRVRER